MTQEASATGAVGSDGPYMVVYSNGFAEEVPDIETARMRVIRPDTRPDAAPRDPIATWRQVRVE